MSEFPYEEGDIVRFKEAPLPSNRTRDYLVTEKITSGIRVEYDGFSYFFGHKVAESIGIVVVKKKN